MSLGKWEWGTLRGVISVLTLATTQQGQTWTVDSLLRYNLVGLSIGKWGRMGRVDVNGSQDTQK